MSIQTDLRSAEQLSEELAAIDVDLARLAERDREADAGIDSLALQARRGDVKAKKRLDKIESARIAEAAKRRRLEAAREAIKGEIQQAQAAADAEKTRERAREARKVLESFRQLGAEIDNSARKLLADYARISSTMAALADLGATRISGEMVKANCRRALMAALIPIRNDLELKLLPPGERRTFSDLVRVWSASIEQAINRNDPQEAPTPAAANGSAVVEQGQALH
jgi:DNA repair exonuclease SbcCD ATPase subunit